jgi:hypothetical protein
MIKFINKKQGKYLHDQAQKILSTLGPKLEGTSSIKDYSQPQELINIRPFTSAANGSKTDYMNKRRRKIEIGSMRTDTEFNKTEFLRPNTSFDDTAE